MAIRRYVAIRRDMWRCHALCVPYVSSIPLCPRTLGPRTSAGRRAAPPPSVAPCSLEFGMRFQVRYKKNDKQWLITQQAPGIRRAIGGTTGDERRIHLGRSAREDQRARVGIEPRFGDFAAACSRRSQSPPPSALGSTWLAGCRTAPPPHAPPPHARDEEHGSERPLSHTPSEASSASACYRLSSASSRSCTERFD